MLFPVANCMSRLGTQSLDSDCLSSYLVALQVQAIGDRLSKQGGHQNRSKSSIEYIYHDSDWLLTRSRWSCLPCRLLHAAASGVVGPYLRDFSASLVVIGFPS
jgi:hypothetical protein